MHRTHESERRRRGEDATDDSGRRGGELTAEAVHLRSYDQRQGYDVAVEARRLDGEGTFERQYYLQPGGTARGATLPPGVYDLCVTLDEHHCETARCHLDASPDHTAVVEVGNGVLSLTVGLVG